MADQEATLAQFMSITGAAPDQARFYLEASNWDQEAAVNNFFSGDGGGAAPAPPAAVSAPAPTTASASASASSSSRASRTGGPRIATFSQLHDDDDAMDSEADGQNEYYTGGEKSGLAVQAPPKESVFDAARRMGAKPIHETQAKKSAFTGTGYKLGETADPSEVVAAPQATASMIPDDNKPLPVTVALWKDGFTVEIGEDADPPALRKGDVPENAQFMEDLKAGVVPEELRHHNGPIGLKLEDHRDQDYVPRKKKLKSFSGTGHKLGSPTPQVLAASSAASAAPAEAKQLEIKDDQPTTKLQIRLSDGTRLVGRFNHTHTVKDVRAFVNASRPGSGNYVLMTTFPNKVITEEDQSLADAKLLNVAIVQKPC